MKKLNLENRPAQHFLDRFPTGGPEFMVTSKGRLHRSGKAIDQGLKSVCEACNNGWMASLQSRASGTLSSIIDNGAWAMPPMEHLIIARWAAMTSCVIETADMATAFALAEDRADIMRGALPPRWTVGIATRALVDRKMTFHHKAFALHDLNGLDVGQSKSHLTLIVIGRIAIMNLGLGAAFDDLPLGRKYLRQMGFQIISPEIDVPTPSITEANIATALHSVLQIRP